MSERLDEIYNNYLNMDEATRIGRSKIAASKILYYLIHTAELTKKESVVILVAMIRLFVAYDKLVTEEECALFNKVIGTEFTLEQFKSIIDTDLNEERVNEMDAIIDEFPVILKGEVCVLGLAFIASDGSISEEEKAIFEKVLN